ncbi:hypothetical protein TURU_013198 [Turdus rufiventris]|nr:hypothetical protein TURU_013198 [Turdus rufiventris]
MTQQEWYKDITWRGVFQEMLDEQTKQIHIFMLTKPVTIGDLLVPEVPLSPESEIFLGLGTSEEKMIANTLTLSSVRSWAKIFNKIASRTNPY